MANASYELRIRN